MSFLCVHRPRFSAPDGDYPFLRTWMTAAVGCSDGLLWFSRGYRPMAERSLETLRSRGTTIHHAAPGCLGLRVHRVFGHSGCRDDRQLHSPRWAARGSPGGWRFLGAKLFGSNNDVSLSDAATGRDTRSTGLSGRCVLFRSVTGRHPGGIRFGVAFASRPTALRGRDPGTATWIIRLRAISQRVRLARQLW